MSVNEIPFNVEIMDTSPQRWRLMKPVRVLDIFEGGGVGNNFHEDGLFSTSIFGRVGSEERDKRFSFIDIRLPVFHPFIYKNLVKLKGLYRAIMAGRGYAIWDEREKDFVQSDEINGETGYHFFFKHWHKIVFKPTGSAQRDQRIQVVEKWKERAVTDKVPVIPAGLRDIQVEADGRTKMDEINDFYIRLIGISNTVSRNSATPVVDTSRWALQQALNTLYEHLESMVSGKKKFVQGNWARRKVFNGTRNVISSFDTAPSVLGDDGNFGPNHTIVGLYQTMKGVLPMTKYHILNGIARDIFNGVDGNARLINPKTLKPVTVKLKPEIVDRWTSRDGVEKLVNAFADQEMRSRPIEIEGMYLGLIYVGPDMTFRIFFDIDELPSHLSREHVHPLTWVEFFYLSQYNRWYTYGCYVTRYPVTGEGSTYPSWAYVKTTVKGERRRELDDNWEPMEGNEFLAREFPSRSEPVHYDTLAPHASRLGGLGADFDGDTSSANFVYSDEALEEIDRYLNSTIAYKAAKGGLKASPVVQTTKLVIRNMTGD